MNHFYLNDLQGGGQRSSVCQLTSQTAAVAGTEPIWGFFWTSTMVLEPRTWAMLHCFPTPLAGTGLQVEQLEHEPTGWRIRLLYCCMGPQNPDFKSLIVYYLGAIVFLVSIDFYCCF